MSSESTVPGESESEEGGVSVDMDWLLECTDNDIEAMHTLVEMYLARTTTQIEELDAALAANSAPDVRRIAHACVGSSGTCGIVKLAQLFKVLEKMGAAGNLAEGPALAGEVRLEFERVKQFLSSKGMF